MLAKGAMYVFCVSVIKSKIIRDKIPNSKFCRYRADTRTFPPILEQTAFLVFLFHVILLLSHRHIFPPDCFLRFLQKSVDAICVSGIFGYSAK